MSLDDLIGNIRNLLERTINSIWCKAPLSISIIIFFGYYTIVVDHSYTKYKLKFYTRLSKKEITNMRFFYANSKQDPRWSDNWRIN